MTLPSRICATIVVTIAIFSANPAIAAGDGAVYAYDSYGRLWTVTYANGTKITYTYDNAGNRQAVVTTCSSSGC